MEAWLFPFGNTGEWTLDLAHARQALCHEAVILVFTEIKARCRSIHLSVLRRGGRSICCVRDLPGPHSEFQASQDYIVREQNDLKGSTNSPLHTHQPTTIATTATTTTTQHRWDWSLKSSLPSGIASLLLARSSYCQEGAPRAPPSLFFCLSGQEALLLTVFML